MKGLILAGGSGTRLWPLSRKNYPKQFLNLNGDLTLFQQTALRLLNVITPRDIVVMTNDQYRFYVQSDLSHIIASDNGDSFHMVLEPAARNTAPAIALGIKYCQEKLKCDDKEVLFISPADHIIRPPEKFADYLRRSEEIAMNGSIVTFGIRPTRPETGYGYIKAGGSRSAGKKSDYMNVDAFVEKPNYETAVRYLTEGNYFWNSGMFAFTIGTMIREFEIHAPKIRESMDIPYERMVEEFGSMPSISIDYAVMEKSEAVVTMPLDIYWNDIGSWDAIHDVLEKDAAGNVKKGDIITIDTKGSLILGSKRLISTIGMDDCLIVETEDAVLIAKKGETQKVKDIVEELHNRERKEALEHVTTYRPWGSYTILEEGPRYKIKRIVVNPGAKLSLQKHVHRSEHWVVVKGAAKVRLDDKDIVIYENESAYVPKMTLHRLENPGKIPVEIIEVQNGEYVEEDDIIRIDDEYGRNT